MNSKKEKHTCDMQGLCRNKSPGEYSGLLQWCSPLEASKFTSYDGAIVGSPILEKGVMLGVLP
jgi:hypothetical protein